MIQQMQASDIDGLVDLALALWPDHSRKEMAAEFAPLLVAEDAAVFGWKEKDRWEAFAQCQLRHDYVEGCETSPVGYLEGIFVRKSLRGKGVARALLGRCQAWAREQGCREFASDCELANEDSLRFHLATGFQEAGRIICFTKRL